MASPPVTGPADYHWNDTRPIGFTVEDAPTFPFDNGEDSLMHLPSASSFTARSRGLGTGIGAPLVYYTRRARSLHTDNRCFLGTNGARP
jgi:hypothetical protein